MATRAQPKLPRIDLMHVSTPTGRAGRLTKAGQHAFTYDTEAIARRDRGFEISLTMPLRPESYVRTPMLPVFQTFLPEGYLKERVAARFGKVLRIDDMALLALTGENAIGRLRLTRSMEPQSEQPANESLAEILQDQGSRDLFEYLSDKYLIRSGIAGVQPKVLLAADDQPGESALPPPKVGIGERATLRARHLIVKVSGDEYPGLSENEYHCLTIARTLGLAVPAFWLSADRKRLAIERFDYDGGRDLYLGFEDMVSLQGLVNDRKYEGSYESVALAIANNATPALKHRSLDDYFASLVLSIALRNGDAHLKNFGMLYTDPGTDDCRLSPLYDIVCTTIYIRGDKPALALDGRRDWPDRKALCAFGREHCWVDHPEAVIDRAVDAVTSYTPDRDDSGIWARMAKAVAPGCRALANARRGSQ